MNINNPLWVFIDSNFLQTIIILLTGTFAFGLYIVQKNDEKNKAARIVLFEIRNIENQIETAKEMTDFYTSSPILIENNWEKYKYLFTDVLDEDDYRSLDAFYLIACRIEEQRKIAFEQVKIVFMEKAKMLQRVMAEQAPLCKGDITEYNNICQGIFKCMQGTNPMFDGNRPKMLIRKLASECRIITSTTAGDKLKKMANKKRVLRKLL